MPLIYKGDTTDNFGKFLPTPFIEKILIDDNGIEITCAVFLTVSDDQCVGDYTAYLDQELVFNLLLSVNKNPDGFDTVVDGKNIFSYYRASQSSNTDTSNITLEPLKFFTDETGAAKDPVADFYDDDGNRVLKFQYILEGNSPREAAGYVSGSDEGGCTGDGTGSSISNGGCCTKDSQCRSNNCYEGTTCIENCTGDATGSSLAVGDCCQNPSQCRSGVCEEGQCQEDCSGTGRTNGECCDIDANCSSGNCGNGECKSAQSGTSDPTLPNGYNCTDDSDCSSGACCRGVCEDAEHYTCAEAQADPKANGESCTINDECLSGNCCSDGSGKCEAMGCIEVVAADPCDTAETDWEIANCPDMLCGTVDDGLYPDGTSCEAMSSWCSSTYGYEYAWDSNKQECYDTKDGSSEEGGTHGAEQDESQEESDEDAAQEDTSEEMYPVQRDTDTDTDGPGAIMAGLTDTDLQEAATDVEGVVQYQPPPPTTPTAWDDVANFYIFAFSTTFDYTTATDQQIDDKLEYIELSNKEISGVSYEKLFEGGVIADQLQVEFFDQRGAIYNGLPLESISGKYYKTTKVTHDQIVNFFEALIGEYRSDNENIKTPLQKMINQISYVLAVYPESIDLLKRLNTLKRAFPNKSRATQLGKLYRRYAKRLSTLNKKLNNSPEVVERIVRNAKIFDMRSVAPLTYTDPNIYIPPSAINDEYYIYNASFMGRTAMYASVSGEGQTEANEGDTTATSTAVYAAESDYLHNYDVILRQFGYFFFDYEKAIRNLSNVTQIVDISKLVNYGIALSYEHFKVTGVTLARESTKSTVVTSIYSEMGSEGYPITEKTVIAQSSDYYPLAITSPGFYTDYETEQATMVGAGVADAAMTEEGNLVLTEEEHMYLVHRNFEPVDRDGEITGLTKDYRLMCFEFQDFMDDDYSDDGAREYTATIEIEDNSIQMLIVLISKFQTSINKLGDYYTKASEQFSYDEGTGLFNEFFTDGMTNLFDGDLINAPWYRAPILYNLHRDLVYNYFGGDVSSMIADAQITINNINPINGSFYALEEFYNTVSSFYADTYDAGGLLADAITTLSDASGGTFTIENTVPYDSAGNSVADDVSDMVYGTIYT